MRKDLKPETSKPQGSKRSGMCAGKLFYPGFLPADRQCVRVLGKGKAPAEEAHKAVVKPLAAGVLAGHEVVEARSIWFLAMGAPFILACSMAS